MKKIEDQIKKELDERVPKMSQRLMSHPITTNQIQNKKEIKWYYALIPSLATLVFTVLLIVMLIKPSSSIPNDSPTTKNNLYMLEVNPTILFTVDENNNLIELKSGNSDADSVLANLDTDQLSGKPISNVIELLTGELIEMGYFSYSDSNVIKISSLNDDEAQTNIIKNDFISYFCQSGYYVAVVNDKLDVNDFNSRYNTNLSNVDNLLAYFNDLNKLNYENIEDSDIDISELYTKNYLSNYLNQIIEDEINRLESEKTLIKAIFDKNNELIDKYKLDYWALKKLNEKFNHNIKNELAEIDLLLKQYNEMTKEDIDNVLEFTSIKGKLDLINIEHIKEIYSKIDNLINSEYLDYINELISLLDLGNKFDDILSIPNTKEELNIKLESINNKIKENKKEKYKNEFDKQKDKITEAEYENFINSIIENNGSLNDFWEKNK